MEPYTRYKPSGIEWIGKIPEHWTVSPLRWHISVKSGEYLSNDLFVSDISEDFKPQIKEANKGVQFLIQLELQNQ